MFPIGATAKAAGKRVIERQLPNAGRYKASSTCRTSGTSSIPPNCCSSSSSSSPSMRNMSTVSSPPTMKEMGDTMWAVGGLSLILGLNGVAVWAEMRDRNSMLQNLATVKKRDTANAGKKKKKWKTSIQFRYTR